MNPMILEVNGKKPVFGKGCALAPGAVITGDVEFGQGCSVWFHAVVRGDVHRIRIGNQVNVQDHALIHCTYEKADVVIGDRVSIGHRAILHGCHIGDDVLVGMGAIVMDHVVVESGVIIAAGSVVLEGSRLESGFLYAGVPARKVKPVSENLQRDVMQRISANYAMYAGWYGNQFMVPDKSD
jgi:carbonic anhydrase/acetyltransferase-like protein (isoleucine patch superfamily)